MNTSNPFIPKGPIGIKPRPDTRKRFRNAVFAVLIVHLVLLVVMLVGCNTEPATLGTYGDHPAALTGPDRVPTPLPDVPSSVPTVAPPPPAPPISTVTPQLPEQAILSAPAQPDAKAAVQAPARSAETLYVVKPGDSLTRIAKTHGTTVNELKAANALKDDRLAVGQKLTIPTHPQLAAAHRASL